MKFGPQRGHVACIFDHFFNDFGLLLVAMIIALVQGDLSVVLENLGVLVIVLLGPVMRLVVYFTTYYAIDEEKILITSGLFRKSQLEVPISTITTVDFSQNVFQQILHVYRLNIDNSSNIATEESKVHMTLKKDDANLVKGLLIKGREGLDGLNLAGEIDAEEFEATEGRKYVISNKDLLLMGALKSKTIFLFELIGVIAAGLALFSGGEEYLVNQAASGIETIGLGLFVLIGAVVVFMLSVFCGMIGSLIRYYGFKVLDNGVALKIEYGLFDHKTFTLPKKKICGFYYEQSALMRLAKVGTVNLMAVGYGASMDEDTSEEAVLFPLLKETEVKASIGEILPDLAEEEIYQKAEKKALRYFFLRFSVIFALVFLGVSIYLPKVSGFFDDFWIVGVVLLLMALISAYLSYRTAAVYGSGKHFTMISGGFKKMTFFIKTNMIESIQRDGSRWKQKRGIADITISCIAPLGLSEQGVDNMPMETFEKLKEYLIY